jgi:hypothetical protein
MIVEWLTEQLCNLQTVSNNVLTRVGIGIIQDPRLPNRGERTMTSPTSMGLCKFPVSLDAAELADANRLEEPNVRSLKIFYNQ